MTIDVKNQITQEDICHLISNQDKQIGKLLLENFISEIDNDVKKRSLLSIPENGAGRGVSRKIKNISLNWKKLLVEGSDSILIVAGATAFPVLIPLAALVAWNKLYSLMDIEINELHATLLFAMWSDKNNEKPFKKETILNITNLQLIKQNKNAVVMSKISTLLDDLILIECIIKTSDDEYLLQEKINIIE